MSEIFTLFSKPLYLGEIEPITKKELNFIKKMEYERVFADNGDYTKNKYVLNLPKLKRLKAEVENHIKIYTKDILHISDRQEFHITNSWIMRHSEGDWAQPHIHTNSLLSGILYLQVFEESGAIRFHNDFGIFPTSLDIEYDRFNVLNSKTWGVMPKDNMILIFPSSIHHSVAPNDTQETRYSLAFNCFVRGKFGTNEYELVLP
jgi:uncharacterized protein (TIGR02466 family)